MKIGAGDFERVFNQCFLETHQTMLVGGGAEPLYLPSAAPSRRPHRVIYRED
jgi:elongation factor P hydroxylase